MSYTLHIWDDPVPSSCDEAEQVVVQLRRSSSDKSPNPKYLEAASQLSARYPCITTLQDDGGVWSDGPLVPQTGSPLWGVGILSQYVDEVAPYVVSTSNRLGLVVYDFQIGKAYLPDGCVLSAAKSQDITKAPSKATARFVFWSMAAACVFFVGFGVWAPVEIWQYFAAGNAAMPDGGWRLVGALFVALIAAAPFAIAWAAFRLARKALIRLRGK